MGTTSFVRNSRPHRCIEEGYLGLQGTDAMSFLLGRTTNSAQQRPPYSSPFGHQQARSEGSVLYDAEGDGRVMQDNNEDELEAAFGGSDEEDDDGHALTSRTPHQPNASRPRHDRTESEESGLMYPDDSLGYEEAAALLHDD